MDNTMKENDKQILTDQFKSIKENPEKQVMIRNMNLKLKDLSPLAKMEELYEKLDQEERAFINQFLGLEPSWFGSNSRKICELSEIQEVDPKDFQVIPLIKTEMINREVDETGPAFINKTVYDAISEMRDAMPIDIAYDLIITSGYRSVAKQVQTFFEFLEVSFKFNFIETAKRVAWPNYSEHVTSNFHAVDLFSMKLIKAGKNNASEEFKNTELYRWLRENAHKFGFVESYPEDNSEFVAEPWHWKYSGIAKS